MVIVSISKEELERLKEVAESKQLTNEHVDALRRMLMKAGVLVKLDEYIALKNNDAIFVYSGDLFVEIGLSANTNGKVVATVVIENVKNVKYRERIDITFVAGEGK
jgi:2-keto-3-deoxy-L-rhamnonate aldolase RhmA